MASSHVLDRACVRSLVGSFAYRWLVFGGDHSEPRSYDEDGCRSHAHLVSSSFVAFRSPLELMAHACRVLVMVMARHVLRATQGPSVEWCIVAPDGVV